MKQLGLQSEAYRYIVQSYRQWLSVHGYHEQTVYQLPHYVQELLYYAESKGRRRLQELDVRLFKEHYHHLKSRANQRQNGGLSNNYLNKHLQALHKFGEYLRRSGRLQLPVLDIRTESDECIVTDVLTQPEIQCLYDVTYRPYEPQRYDKGILFHEAMQLRDRAMLTVYYGCGLRRSEGYHLDIGDVHFHRGLLHVRHAKGNRERLVPVTGQGIRYLEQYLQEGRAYLSSGKETAFL
ncbi:tyrosine-type recombinase/integrase [Chitinophaga sedimenti]|uniref:tyrosine-type recombinase/integrase n=1 Tax=Chitinophaga sedimenti TaxID=2033606 RepID=UPI00249EDC78|nr:tyrosine-type recombinase/integrase [Chitinophaga sedimenti]